MDKIVVVIKGVEVAVAYAFPGETPTNKLGIKFSSVTEFYDYALEVVEKHLKR